MVVWLSVGMQNSSIVCIYILGALYLLDIGTAVDSVKFCGGVCGSVGL